MKNNTYTLSEYVHLLKQGGSFIIPSYQRGYVWGQEKPRLKKNSVLNILDTLIDGFVNDKDVFLQGITVCEKGADIILVDGQQRTTFFYLFLKYLEYNEYLRIVYAVRKESDNFLKNLDIEDEKLINILDELCEEVADRANYLNKRGKTVVLKIKYGDFTQITRSLSMNNPISSHNDIRSNIYNLFKNIEHNHKDIRLIGVTLSNLVNEEVTNISFFEYIKTIENNKK